MRTMEEIRNITLEDIARINELYYKSQTAQGLTEEEKQEQLQLRKDYIQAIRRNMRGNLDNIDLVDKDGSVTNLGEKYGNKNV